MSESCETKIQLPAQPQASVELDDPHGRLCVAPTADCANLFAHNDFRPDGGTAIAGMYINVYSLSTGESVVIMTEMNINGPGFYNTLTLRDAKNATIACRMTFDKTDARIKNGLIVADRSVTGIYRP